MTTLQSELFRLSSFSWIALMAYWFLAGRNTKISIKQQSRQGRFLYIFLLVTAFAALYYELPPGSLMSTRLFTPPPALGYAGMVINITGVLFAILARFWLGKNWSGIVTLKEDHQLVTDGPYRFSRHPIYTGILLGLTGAAMIQCEYRSLIGIMLFVIAAHIKISTEEQFMRSAFYEYNEYSRRVKKLLPFIY